MSKECIDCRKERGCIRRYDGGADGRIIKTLQQILIRFIVRPDNTVHDLCHLSLYLTDDVGHAAGVIYDHSKCGGIEAEESFDSLCIVRDARIIEYEIDE